MNIFKVNLSAMTALTLFLLLMFALFSCHIGEIPDYTTIIADGLPVFEGVTLKTELEFYPEGTKRILAFWENDTEFNMTYGNGWQLEKYDEKKDNWTIIQQKKGGGFTDIGIRLSPQWYQNHTYHIAHFDENIKEGRYRIKTDFFVDDINKNESQNQFGVTAEFTVTSDKSLLQKSELDFDAYEESTEITISCHNREYPKIFSKDNYFPIHVYKNKQTYDTTMVIDGDEQYEIAQGTGKWGVVTCNYYAANDDKYLIYSYSREENGKKQSYIAIFDLVAKKEIYRSDAYAEYDISINYRQDLDIFKANFMIYEDDGASQSSAPGFIGYFKYDNGVFSVYEFSDADETLTFDDILKDISKGNMTAELLDNSQTEAKISAGDDIYYAVYSNPDREIKISALDTFVGILNNCAYIKIAPLNEPVLYALVFHASDIDGNKAEICVYVTHSSIRLEYNGIFDDMGYINKADSENCEYNMKYYNVSAGFDLYIAGVIPDENGQRATIW